MTKRIFTLEAMHNDHRHWHQEHQAWTEDIAHWQAQHKDMLADFLCLEAAIRKYGAALESYAADIDRHEKTLHRHEHGIVELIRHARGMEQQEHMVQTHKTIAAQHESQRQAYERIKRHHYVMLTRLAKHKESLEVDFSNLLGLPQGPPGAISQSSRPEIQTSKSAG